MELSEWAHGFVVGGGIGVIWGLLIGLLTFLGAGAMKVERMSEPLPDNVRSITRRRRRS